MRMYTSINIHRSEAARPIAGMPFDSVGRFWATLLLRTTCMCLWCNWVASCVGALQNKNQKPKTKLRFSNLGALQIIALVSLMHIQVPCLFACFYESVSCVHTFFSTCRSTCVACAECFVFCSIFLTTVMLACSFFYKFNRHLCHGAYWCIHNPAHMSNLHLPFSNSCVRVSKHVYAFSISSIFIHTYRHVHMYGLCSVLYFYPSFCFLSSFSKI